MSEALTREHIETQIRQALLEQLHLPVEKVTLSASFREDLGIDSLDIVDLMFEIEKRFDVVIPDADLVRLVTVADLVNYLSEKRKSA